MTQTENCTFYWCLWNVSALLRHASRRPDPWLSKKRAILSAPTLFPHTLPKFSFYPKSIFVSENNIIDPTPVSSRVTIGSYTFIVFSFLQRAIEEKENRIWKHLPKYDVWVKTLLFNITKCRRGGGRNFLNMAKRKDEAQKPFKIKQLLKTETINNNYTVQKLLWELLHFLHFNCARV